MSFSVQQVQYFNASFDSEAGEAYDLLADLAGLGVNLLAFSALPVGANRTQFTLFPDEPKKFITDCKRAGLALDGPHSALVVQGNDKPGILAGIHTKLHRANVKYFAANGVTTGKGDFGYVIYFREQDTSKALAALQE